MHADQITAILGAPDPEVTDRLIAKSSLERFGDLCAIAPIVHLIAGLEPYDQALLALIDDLARVGPEADARLRSPVFRGWLWRMGRTENWNAADPYLLEHLDLIDNMRFSFRDAGDWEGLLAVHNGVAQTWDTGLAVAGLPDGVAFFAKRGERLQVKDQTGARYAFDLCDLDDARLLRAPLLPGTSIAVRNDLPLLSLRIREDVAMPGRSDGIVPEYDYRSTSYGAFDLAPIARAAELVRQAWPEEYADWGLTLRAVVPRLEPPQVRISSFAALSHQGAIWVGPRPMLEMIDSLVHEQSHVKQRYIEDTADLIDPEQADETFRVGWRPDPRPLAGIYEGVYVNLHVCEALGRIVARGLVGPAEGEQLMKVRRGHAANVREALGILSERARFTPAGAGFLDWAETWTQRFEGVAQAA